MFFGTDGIRGRAGSDITPQLAYRLGYAVANVFSAPVFVGYDTRESSPELSRAVIAGLTDGGATAINLGVIATPAVAVIAEERAGVGIIVSASHNPWEDNGLKVLGYGGGKLDHDTETAVSAALDLAPSHDGPFAEVTIDESGATQYAERLVSLFAENALSSLHLVVDCANGAGGRSAPDVLRALGATVTVLHNDPTGRNINDECGSTHPESLVATVVELGADLGIALDGDADRLIAVDADGIVRDGDDLLAVFATDFAQRGVALPGVVLTTMSNWGVRRALEAQGLDVVETDVGDRHVLFAMEERGWPLGGEQSGHLIFADYSPTGDGLLTGLLLAELVVRRGPLHLLADGSWHRVPQRLVNVPKDLYNDEATQALLNDELQRFSVRAEDVRIIIRPSGTEPVVRVMIETDSAELVESFCEKLLEIHSPA